MTLGLRRQGHQARLAVEAARTTQVEARCVLGNGDEKVLLAGFGRGGGNEPTAWLNLGVETQLNLDVEERWGLRAGYTMTDHLLFVPWSWAGAALGATVYPRDERMRVDLTGHLGFMFLGAELGPYVHRGAEGQTAVGVLGGAVLTVGVLAAYARTGISPTEAADFYEAGLRVGIPLPVGRTRHSPSMVWDRHQLRRRADARRAAQRAAFRRLRLNRWTVQRCEARDAQRPSAFPMLAQVELRKSDRTNDQKARVRVKVRGRDASKREIISRVTYEHAYGEWYAGWYPLSKLNGEPKSLFLERGGKTWEGRGRETLQTDFELSDFVEWSITAQWVSGSNRVGSNPRPLVAQEEIVWTTNLGACRETATRKCRSLGLPALMDERPCHRHRPGDGLGRGGGQR